MRCAHMQYVQHKVFYKIHDQQYFALHFFIHFFRTFVASSSTIHMYVYVIVLFNVSMNPCSLDEVATRAFPDHHQSILRTYLFGRYLETLRES